MRRATSALILVAGFAAAACTAILDFDLDPPLECWCGQQWRAEIVGALAFDVVNTPKQVATSDTVTSRCLSQSQSDALSTANPNDPIYQDIAAGLEAEARSNCINWAMAELGQYYDYTTCDVATVQIYDAGACWIEETEAQPCPATQVCGRFYDCDDTPITRWKGQLFSDTGGNEPVDEHSWDCE